MRSSVEVTYRSAYTRYVNSEGTVYTRSEPVIKLEVTARTQAENGLPISDSFTVYGHTAEDLASRTPMSDNSQFEAFFSQMLGRLGVTSFQERVGARVLPAFISLRDDPTQASFGGSILMGNSAIDDDGVRTREILVIDHGILKNLLTSRVPARGFFESSGSRHGWGAVPSNLFLTSERGLSASDLKKELLRLAKERGLDYGIVVRHVGGGIHIAELPVESFKEIVAIGDTPAVYSDELIPGVSALFGTGAFPGNDLPVVSCVTPSLLFEEVSLAKTDGPFPALPVSKSPLAEK